VIYDKYEDAISLVFKEEKSNIINVMQDFIVQSPLCLKHKTKNITNAM
jgi:hypothetical protein